MTDRLRVVYSFAHALDWPGIATTALHQVRALAERGVEVELFCTSQGTAELPASVRVVETMTVAGRRVPHRVLGVQRTYSRHDRIVARRLAHGPRPDIVHAWPRACLRTFSVARSLGVPTVRECPNPHTASVYRESAAAAAHAGVTLSRGHSHAESPAVLRLEEREFAAATALAVPSAYAAARFVDEGLAPSKLVHHRYGCDVERFRPVRRRPDEPLQGCFLGRGDPTKGLHVALRAWLRADLPAGSMLHVAGAIDPAYRRSLAAELADPRIQVHGFVADTARLLAACDVLLLPTWTEGSALVVYEAQSTGCIPLVSTASGAHGVVGEDYLEHEVGDAARLSTQLGELAADTVVRSRLRGSLLAHRAEFSWQAAAFELERCYRAVLRDAREASATRSVRGLTSAP